LVKSNELEGSIKVEKGVLFKKIKEKIQAN
jgi:hypothetical protein